MRPAPDILSVYMDYFKKVNAEQFSLSEAEKEAVRHGEARHFRQARIKSNGSNLFIAMLRKGESEYRIHEGQWLVEHPNGLFEILWPDEFNKHFQPI